MKSFTNRLLFLVSIAILVSFVIFFDKPAKVSQKTTDKDMLFNSISTGMSQYAVRSILQADGKLSDSSIAPRIIADIHGFENGIPYDLVFNSSNSKVKNQPLHPNAELTTLKYDVGSDWIAVSYYGNPIERPHSAHPLVYKFCSWKERQHNTFP